MTDGEYKINAAVYSRRYQEKDANIFSFIMPFFYEEAKGIGSSEGRKEEERKVVALTWFQLGGSRYTGTEEKTMLSLLLLPPPLLLLLLLLIIIIIIIIVLS